MATIVMLGPQRQAPTLNEHASAEGRLAVIAAGWLEAERDPRVLAGQLTPERTVPLDLYTRAERAFEEDPELFAAHRLRQRRMEQLQRIYRRRLDHALAAHRELAELATDPSWRRSVKRRPGDAPASSSDVLEDEVEAALEAVRALDRYHLERVGEVHRQFEEEATLETRPALERQRREVEELLADCDAVVLAGGHVAVLLSRLRLFALEESLRQKPLLAISAGAMALATRVVLFHDSPPWGAGNAEVLDHGLGLAPGIQPLPHARQRLRLDDPRRVALLSRRFAPERCIGLDEGSWLRVEPGSGAARGPWHAAAVDLLEESGRVERVGSDGVGVERVGVERAGVDTRTDGTR